MKWFSFERPKDSLTDLTEVCTRLDGLELVLNELKDKVSELRHTCKSPEEMIGEKMEVLHRWEEIEEPIMRCARELQCIVSGDKTVVDLAQMQMRRVETVLNEGSDLTALLSAARWAVQDITSITPAYLKTDLWLESVSALEQEETRCRFEYQRGEEIVFSDLVKAFKPKKYQPSSKSSSAIPAHWTGTSFMTPRLHDVTKEMADSVSAIFEGSGTVCSIYRLESLAMWSAYIGAKEALQQKGRQGKPYLGIVTATDLMLDGVEMLEGDLSEELNEKWLLLPCRNESDVEQVLQCGVQHLRKNSGLFGAGLYLAETPARANKVCGGATPTIVLVRALLTATPHVTANPISAPPEPVTVATCKMSHSKLQPPSRPDSWLDEHREFIVSDSTLCYPAYVIRYTKGHDTLAFHTY
eukprot:TRINITY_DN9759_c0_g1_i1.p1 TRINITY_DN9759_c0_g1~~TRINITY_DN9759_c0_g1_i1.p1  ORF type:complete len:412 (+),score=61.27 TRINITY_DN9759_c0_g1_i1:40-1275(+)